MIVSVQMPEYRYTAENGGSLRPHQVLIGNNVAPPIGQISAKRLA
jgi:hypothetical protein